MSNVNRNYSTTFDATCAGWTKNRELNRLYLIYSQNYFNELLRSRGYVFLRDIYEYVGIPITKESVVCGWLYREGDITRDNFIDFGLYEGKQDTDNPNVELSFNVDGDILSQI